MVFVDGGDQVAAFTVDRTLGIEDVVVRALPPHAPIDAIIAGMALDGEGVPYAVVDPRALVAAVGRASRTRASEPARPPPILVVDDSPTTRLLEQSILESAGYDVELAVSAEDALARLARGTLRDVARRRRDAGHGRLRVDRRAPRATRSSPISRRCS